MFFLIDNKNHIIFGWSPKCGCIHIKSIYYFLQNNEIKLKNLHGKMSQNKLSNDILDSIENYTILIFCRNPYNRLVSGFLDKYRINGGYRHMWLEKDIKFSKFVNELGNWEIIDKHHFSNIIFTDKILNCKIIKCFDIENIDYDYIESYIKKIPKQLINFKGKHARYNVKQDVNINKMCMI